MHIITIQCWRMTIKATYIRRRLILCHHIYKELLQVPMKSGTEVCVQKNQVRERR